MKLFGKTFSISLLAIIVMASFMTLRMFNKHAWTTPEKVIAWDVISYYAYLPAAFIEHDLTLAFTDHEHAGTYWPEVLPDGSKVIKTSMGVSLMYMPFFLVAHATAAPLGYDANGYTAPYACALMLAGLCYAFLGLFLLRRVLRRHFSDWITAVVLLLLMVGTNLYWYTLYEAPMSHAFSFCLFALLALLTERWHEKPSAGNSVAVGLTMGLIALVRPTNVLVVIYFLLYGVHSKATLQAKWQLLRTSWAKLLLLAVAAVAVWVPQMAYWHLNTGQWLFYSYGGNERFFFGDPKIWQGLFGFRKGWLVYTPLMLLALAGMVPLYRRHREHFWGVVLFLVLNIYVVFSWWCWWYGGSRGMRAMIDCYPLMALPLAAWVEWVAACRKGWRVAWTVLSLAVASLSVFHTLRYIDGSIHWDSMTRAAYFDGFFHSSPSERFQSLLEEPDYEAAREGRR